MTIILVVTLSLFPFSLLSSGSNAFATAGSQFYHVSGVVPLGIVPDPDNSKLYLINSNKSITVVEEDDPTSVVAQINNPDYEEGEFSFANLGLNRQTGKLYLVSENSQGIYVIDGQTDRIVKRIDLSSWGISIAVNPVTNKIYAFGYDDVLQVIDGFSDEIEDTIDIGQYILDSVGPYDSLVPAEVSVNPNTNTIYTLHHLTNLILAIDGTNYEIIRNTTLVERPFAMLINQAVDKLYVSSNQGPLTILDGSSLEVISTINGVGYNGAIPSMWRGIGPSGYTIYVPSAEGTNVAMIDSVHDRKVGDDVAGLGFSIWGLSADDETGRAYATFDGSSNFLVVDPWDFGSIGDNKSSIDVMIGNNEFSIAYNMSSGGSILDLRPDPGTLSLGSLSLTIASPSAGYLDLAFPRELYDLLSYTDHELVAFIDELEVPVVVMESSSCEDIMIRVPVDDDSHSLAISHSDLPGTHNHPYPPRLTLERNLTVEKMDFEVRVLTDATKCDISFVMEEKKLHFDVESNPLLPEGERGYFAISVPRQLLGGNYTVLIDGTPTDNVQIFTTALEGADGSDPNTSTISFSYESGAKSVDIIGTEVIPEFGVLAVFIVAIGILVVILSSRANLFKSSRHWIQ